VKQQSYDKHGVLGKQYLPPWFRWVLSLQLFFSTKSNYGR